MQFSVNGVTISSAEIGAEMQNHPADSPEGALAAAQRALLVRELLVQRAKQLGIAPSPQTDGAGRTETTEDALVRQVVEKEVEFPQISEDVCRRYFEERPERFMSPPLYEASHILFSVQRDDQDAYQAAEAKARELIESLAESPGRFGNLARRYSECPSGKSGGRLGQVSRGDTVPEVETFLESLEIGQLCPIPVKSPFGIHILRLDNRIEGRPLPFSTVRRRIEAHIRATGWKDAIKAHIRYLASEAEIEGTDELKLLGK